MLRGNSRLKASLMRRLSFDPVVSIKRSDSNPCSVSIQVFSLEVFLVHFG